MRDIVLEETIYMDFTTRAFASGVPTVLAGTPVLSVLEENNATPITSGVSVSVDRASVVGLNMATIVATAANGYESGKGYSVYISTGTVGGVSVVGEVVGQFTIDASAAAQDLANGTDGLGAIKTDTAAILVDTGTTLDGKINTIDTNVDSILVDTAEIGTAGAGLTNINLPNQTMDITGNITGNLSGSVGSLTGHTNQTADHTANIAAILTDTGTTLDTKLNDIQGATFSTSTDSLEAIRDRGDAAWTTGAGGSDRLLMVDTTIATLATQTSFTLTAGSTDDDAYNNLSIVVEDVSTSTQKAVGMVLDYTGSTKTVTLKEALAFTIATTDKVYILAENSLKSTVANRQLDVTATGAAGIDWGNVENPATALDLSGTDIQLVDTATTVTGGATASALATVDTNVDAILVDTAEIGAAGAGLTALATQASVDVIDANVDQIETAVITNAAGTDIAADIIAVKAETALIVADTNELQTDWADAGRLDAILDARMAEASISTTGGAVDTVTTCTTTTTNTDMRGTDSAATAANLATVDTNVDAILVDTAEIGTAGAGLTAILTTQMTESYAADGTAPTLAQAVFLIQQTIGDFAIAGTTITAKKLDGSTTAATYTLDDGTSPTSRTRAT